MESLPLALCGEPVYSFEIESFPDYSGEMNVLTIDPDQFSTPGEYLITFSIQYGEYTDLTSSFDFYLKVFDVCY